MSLVTIPDTSRVPRDGYDRPLVVPRKGGKPVPHSRTTTFIDCIEDKSNLTDWRVRSAVEGVIVKPSLLDEAAALDKDDPQYKKKMKALVERMLNAAGANDKREKGTHLHELSELVDANLPLPDGTSDSDVRDMGAYMMATLDFDFEHVEKLVVVNSLGVAGTPDRVARYTGWGPLVGKEHLWFDNALLITDLKTGTVEYGALKMAAQLGIYSRGEFYDHTKFPVEPVANDPDGKKALARWKKVERTAEEAEAAYTSLGEVNQEWGVVFNLPSGSGECTLHWVNLTLGWEMAELAQTIRKARGKKGALVPFATPQTVGAT